MEITLEEFKANVTTQFEAIKMIADALEPDDPNSSTMRESATKILNLARIEYQAGKMPIEALNYMIHMWSTYH